MNGPTYTPMLKSKPGEARALMRLHSQVKASIIPLFDVLALKSEVANGVDVHAHLEKQANNIAGAWNGRGPCYVDLLDIVPGARGYRGAHPVGIVLDKLSFERVEAIPVVGLERDVAYKLAVRQALSEGGRGLAVRLDSEDLQLPSTLAGRVRSLIDELGASNLPLHVLMDFRSIEHTASDIIQSRVVRALIELRKLNPVRIVFAASAIVANMGDFKRNTVNRVARRDLLIWQLIADEHADVDYGDYGVIGPEYVDLDPKRIKPAAKIRYAGDTAWVIVKGTKWTSDTTQHRRLARDLSVQSEFRRHDCWGGDSILSAATGGHAFRRLEDWVMIDQNTHISHTVRQLARHRVAGTTRTERWTSSAR
jgi:hypothetical protein